MINHPTDCTTTFKEESSDESTIISSQASTLTRNQNHNDIPEAMVGQICSDDEASDEEDPVENGGASDDEHDGKFKFNLLV